MVVKTEILQSLSATVARALQTLYVRCLRCRGVLCTPRGAVADACVHVREYACTRVCARVRVFVRVWGNVSCDVFVRAQSYLPPDAGRDIPDRRHSTAVVVEYGEVEPTSITGKVLLQCMAEIEEVRGAARLGRTRVAAAGDGWAARAQWVREIVNVSDAVAAAERGGSPRPPKPRPLRSRLVSLRIPALDDLVSRGTLVSVANACANCSRRPPRCAPSEIVPPPRAARRRRAAPVCARAARRGAAVGAADHGAVGATGLWELFRKSSPRWTPARDATARTQVTRGRLEYTMCTLAYWRYGRHCSCSVMRARRARLRGQRLRLGTLAAHLSRRTVTSRTTCRLHMYSM